MNLPKHIPSLDGMRGVAILLVILTHCGTGWQAALSIFEDTTSVAPLSLPKIVWLITSQANHGVQLFFIISAFTLTLSSFERNGNLLAYAARRVARVGPAYWLAGILYTIMAGLSPRLWAPQGIHIEDIALASSFLSAWQGTSSLAVVPGGWSVSCEVTFYLLLPLLLFLINGRLIVCFILLVVSCFISAYDFDRTFDSDAMSFAYYVNPMQQLPVFILGVYIALIAKRMSIFYIPYATVIFLFLSLFFAPFIAHIHLVSYALTYITFSIFASIAVLYSAAYPPMILMSKFIRHIGKVSYSMYLIHFAVLPLGMKFATFLSPSSDLIKLAILFCFTVPITFALASISFRYIEQPPIRWMSRVLRTHRPASV